MTTRTPASILGQYDLTDADTRSVAADELLDAGFPAAAAGLAEDDYSFLGADELVELLATFGWRESPADVPGLAERIKAGPTLWVLACDHGGDFRPDEPMSLVEAVEGAGNWLVEGDWGPLTEVTGQVYPAGTDGRWCAWDSDYQASATTPPPAVPDCPEADEHEWTSEHEGGCRENPGVWSTGGTSLLFVSRCRHCGMERHEHHLGTQRNPGEHDSITYGEPDAEWVARHYGDECD